MHSIDIARMTRARSVRAGGVALLFGATVGASGVWPAHGDCPGDWVPTFGSAGGALNGTLIDLIVMDEESGPALYACGLFAFEDDEIPWGVGRWSGTRMKRVPR